ncbi:MAG: L-2-hydroxyglutarate oxidase [Candidatus Nanopelagicales bacterium]|nr:L-2-hydroxyglutarate oxidase [Candidatus Nanopelagicales bacterium]MCF8538356.1 L-2-hydroxyglutarate oxidase [Candidatus Nanopelagicales bacterium]MCF8555991.1 L-2-hydroxyglutarate oxidase [Candidatus Nanopelagicales bacterium]
MTDVLIIGGGIVGLAIADELLRVHPDLDVEIHDKETSLAQHASGRNSGVLHAGFYYYPDSMKARLTRVGNSLLREFCAERGVAVRDVGKVVVTRSAEELPLLHDLYERGVTNGVELEVIDERRLAELEPLAKTHEQALWSPTTGSADPMAVITALAARVQERGGRVVLGSSVRAAGPGWVTTSEGYRSVGHVVNAAGLHADTVGRWFGVGEEYRMLPFKGLYWYGSWPAGRLQRHVYPVPDPRNPFLGVHLTVAADGRAKIGPTAIPALSREAYSGVSGLSAGEAWQVARTLPRFLASPHHDAKSLIASEMPKYLHSHLVKEAAQLVPSVRPEDFRTKGRAGIRAQLFDTRRNRLEMDFVVRPGPRSTHVLNAVSPGWTTALAMARDVVADWRME